MNRILLTASLFASASLIAGAANARPMTPEDVAKLESVGTIAVSPDGRQIAYTTASLPDVTEGEENGTTRQQLMLATGPDAARAFLPDDVSVGGVEFSPDGRMISFLWTKDGEKRAVWAFPQMAGRSASWPLSRVSACRAMPGHPTAR